MLSTVGIQPSEGHRIISLAKDSISPVSQNVNNKIKKSLDDVDVQPIEESSDGATMQNYNRAIEALHDTTEGQYYEVTLSIGNNGSIATVYNVGKIKESVLPSAKILAVVGSKPLGKTPSCIIVSHPEESVNKEFSFEALDNEYLNAVNSGDMETGRDLPQSRRTGASQISDKRLDLFMQTIYVNTKRENLATPIGETFLYHTPEANSGTVFSGDIVPQDPEVVKPAVKKICGGYRRSAHRGILGRYCYAELQPLA